MGGAKRRAEKTTQKKRQKREERMNREDAKDTKEEERRKRHLGEQVEQLAYRAIGAAIDIKRIILSFQPFFLLFLLRALRVFAVR
jgi:hypothetical protein